MEQQREEILHLHGMEKEEMAQNFDRANEELSNENIALQRERDDSLLLAENEKQQVSYHNSIPAGWLWDGQIHLVV